MRARNAGVFREHADVRGHVGAAEPAERTEVELRIGRLADLGIDLRALHDAEGEPIARRAGGEPLVLGGTAEGATSNDVPIILRDTIGLTRLAHS